MQKKVVIDTNVYIDIFNEAKYLQLRDPIGYIVFLAYPVLHELWMGARGERERKHLVAFQQRFVTLKRLIVPSETSLIQIGRLCQRFRASGKLDPVHPKHYNDITIAVLARQIGAAVVTRNTSDFQLIRAVFDFRLETP